MTARLRRARKGRFGPLAFFRLHLERRVVVDIIHCRVFAAAKNISGTQGSPGAPSLGLPFMVQ